MSLGSDIKAALDALSDANKADMAAVWEAIGGEIEDETIGITVGCIMMFDGTGWVDNSTMAGWYACIPENSGQGCPDMVNSFVMGKVVADAGTTGGANSITLASANLPTHTHTINHDHPSKTSSGPTSTDHTHTTNVGSHGHGIIENLAGTSAPYGIDYGTTANNSNSGYIKSTTIGNKTSGNPNTGGANRLDDHTHSVNLVNYTGSSGDGGFANTAFDNRPVWYSMIFIRKCA